MSCCGSPSDGTGKTTRDKGGRDPPDVTLDEIAKDLLSFFNIKKTEENIKKKYDIKQDEHDFWPEDDIKRAWGKIQRMNINSDERKHWSAVIILQIVTRSFVCGGCKLQAAQENRHATTDEQGCETTPSLTGNPEERSSQSSAELETLGAVGGVQQSSGAGLETSKCKPTEDSGLGSESRLPTSGTDEAFTAELRGTNCYANQNNNETKDAAFVNENEDTLVSNEQQKNVLCVADVHDKENVRWEDDRRSTVGMNPACGKAQRMKGNSEDRSSQSNAEPETVGAAGGDQQDSGAYHTTYSAQTYSVSQGQTAAHFTRWSQDTGNPPGAADDQDRPDVALQNEGRHGPMDYIRIPLSLMSHNEPRVGVQQDQPDTTGYKFIDGSPSALINEDLRKRKSYAMSFNNVTQNANWVYEILNRQTVAHNNDVDQGGFGDPYHKGHLAAAANHRWCQEALNDANSFSNIVPQHKTLNKGPWLRLENRCRDLTKEVGIRNVHVYSGPLYREPMNPPWIQGKAVPSHFFKVILLENENGTVREPECYLMPNFNLRLDLSGPQSDQANTDFLRECWKIIDEIEEDSGLSFKVRTNVRGNYKTVTMTLEGHNRNRKQKTAEIQVKIRP